MFDASEEVYVNAVHKFAKGAYINAGTPPSAIVTPVIVKIFEVHVSNIFGTIENVYRLYVL